MAKAKRLPSGAWNVLVYSHTDSAGKRHYESFTASSKAEAELKAAEFKANKKRRSRTDLSVDEAVEGYINAKSGVLSPSTVRGYQRMMHYYEPIGHRRIRSLTSEDLQLFISDLSRQISAKSVRNIYGLLSAALAMYDPDAVYRVTLPSAIKRRAVSPADSDIKRLLDAAQGQLRTCILLGMRGLRRGEICALKYEDIEDGIAHIHADVVKGPDGRWVYKEMPKTSDGDRFVRVPDLGDGEGFIVRWTPDSVTKRFIELKKTVGIDIRFHDLRHYFASAAAALNIPDLYIADMGGWRRGSNVMKSVYQNNIQSMSDYYSDKMESHLRDIETSAR